VHQDKAQDPETTSTESRAPVPALEVGTPICVRNRFIGDFTSGFEVAEVLSDGYRIRRLSDGHVFPDVFAFEDVRLERRQHPLREAGGSYLDRRH